MKNKSGIIIFIVFLMLPFIVAGQSWTKKFKWWNEKHNWDGHTPWQQYITLSSAYMGPNALPVPQIRNAKIRDHVTFEHANNYYYQPGDETADLNLKFIYPFHKDIQVEARMVPVEYFHISDTLIRDKRAIRHKNPEGTAVGDLTISTYMQILERENWPDIVFGFSFRTASGSDLSMARYTDTPGYHFDLSFGDSFKVKSSWIRKIRIYGMTGFYAYQTYGPFHNQNDAILYGLGFNTVLPNWTLKNRFGGYYGYLGNGDRPAIYRLEIALRKKYYQWFVRYQKGINDFPYQAFGTGIRWSLNKE